MSLLSWFWLLLGLFLIYRAYKKAIEKNDIDIIIKVRGGADAPKIISESAELTLARIQKKLFKLSGILISVLYLLIVTNLVFNYLKGWYLLGLSGLVISYLYLKIESLPSIALLKSRQSALVDEYRTSQENLQSSRFIGARNTSLGIVIASLVFSGNWAYQVQKNQSEEKLWAMNEMNDLVGQGWCENFWDIDATLGPDGDYDVSKTGGWPCITIGSVSNIRFQDSGKDLEMCFSFSLRRSNDGPWNPDSSEEYDYGSTCASDNWIEEGGGWDEDSLWENVRNEINLESELNSFANTMCRNYYWRMSSEQQSVYC